jgi:hypothetical protein
MLLWLYLLQAERFGHSFGLTGDACSIVYGGYFMDPASFDLTLEQQFQMRLVEESTQGMSREQAVELLVEASRLLMLKDNVIRDLVRKVAPASILM